VRKGKLTDEVKMLRADEEAEAVIAPADTPVDDKGKILEDRVIARKKGEFAYVAPDEVQYRDISPEQIVGVRASLIPFLEHDDANRALMGSNMQRQAVPLVRTEAPLVGTGMEGPVARNSGMVVRTEVSGPVSYVDSQRVKVGETEYRLRKFVGL